jgi:hypothetical protein
MMIRMAWGLANIATRKASPPTRFLGERVHPADVVGGVLVIGGILLGLLKSRSAGKSVEPGAELARVAA